MEDTEAVRASVREYYGSVLSTSKDLKTSACTAADRPHAAIRKLLCKVPAAVKDKFYGCGCPLPLGIDGLSVLDLGSGSGRDVYLAAALVGPTGRTVGVDMTDEQLDVARAHADEFAANIGFKPNMSFVKGYIELLADAGVEDNSYDLVISNCVINLSLQKERVLEGCFRALRSGGEMYFSDVYCTRRLPEAVRKHEVLWGECIAGALYTEDFRRICQRVGFTDPRVLSSAEIVVRDPELKELIGEARFFSITYRLFKLPSLEDKCEDYGQVAVYKGTIPGHTHAYDLDDHHRFETGRPMLVCGNSAAMVGESWLAPHFTVTGNRDTHFGLFDCGPAAPSAPAAAADSSAGLPGGCC